MWALLRKLCLVEGISCILLFFVAMPVKYLLGEPRLVSVVGMLHGLLWTGLVFALLHSYQNNKMKVNDAFWILFASTFPFGMFWADKKLLSLEKESGTSA